MKKSIKLIILFIAHFIIYMTLSYLNINALFFIWGSIYTLIYDKFVLGSDKE